MPVGTLQEEDSRSKNGISGPNERTFALTLGTIIAIIAIVQAYERSPWGIGWGSLALALIGCGLVKPSLLSGLNSTWLRFGLLLYRIVSPIIIAVLFYGTILPIGLLMRVLGKDPLKLKLDKSADTYWLERSDGRSPSEAMRQQY